jgi:hypothetical protein
VDEQNRGVGQRQQVQDRHIGQQGAEQAGERQAVIGRERSSLYLGGLLGALLAYVPILHLLALPYTAILFVHLCLGALRELRNAQGVSV